VKAKITKLSLLGFRGATQPVEINFDSKKPVTLLFGENGTGKSTIADALDFICNRRFGSLEDRSMSSQAKTHVASLGQDARKLRVFIEASTGTFTAELTRDGPVVTPATGCVEARILRRSNVQQLVDAQPKPRFEAFKAFISVPGIQKSEDSLREAVRDVQNNYNESVRSYTQADAALEQLWTSEGKPGSGALDWGTQEAAKDLSTLESDVSAIGNISRAFEQAKAAQNRLDQSLLELSAAQEAQRKAEEDLAKTEAKQAQGGAMLLRLIEDAKAYISAHTDSPECPVCQQSVDNVQLIARLQDRTIQMTDLSEAFVATSAGRGNVESKQSVADEAKKGFCQQTIVVGELLQGCSLKEVVDHGVKWADYEGLLKNDAATEAVETQARTLLSAALSLEESLVARQHADQKSINQRNAIKGYVDTHVDKIATAEALEKLAEGLNKALEIVSHRRKTYIEGVLATIAEEVERLYVKLHPDEGIGKIRFYLKPKAIGSLEFDGQFLTKSDVPPQAYYSESHLDTLGICIFLALAKHFMTDNTIVVLDDVVTSVDSPHLKRFMDLLHEEAPNFNQVIVTTHYRPWKDRYRNARGPAAKTQVIELRIWSIESGVQADEAVNAIDELRACLNAAKLDRQAVASKAGIQLESTLDFLIHRYSCKMPVQDDPNYTLGALAMGIDSKLGKVLKTITPSSGSSSNIETMLKPLIDNATSEGWIRNRAGCHFHDLGSEISDSEIKGFGEKVLGLADALVCAGCKAFPERRPSGSYWQCECGNIELHPLVQPGAPLASLSQPEPSQ
jgi:energy-coupling factor transporter ATP-binding protein EcfA2